MINFKGLEGLVYVQGGKNPIYIYIYTHIYIYIKYPVLHNTITRWLGFLVLVL